MLVEYDREGKARKVIVHRLAVNQAILDWSRHDPEGLLAAAKTIASGQSIEDDEQAKRLFDLMTTESNPKGPQIRHYLTSELLRLRPQALVEAIEILMRHRDEVVRVMTRYGYTDPSGSVGTSIATSRVRSRGGDRGRRQNQASQTGPARSR